MSRSFRVCVKLPLPNPQCMKVNKPGRDVVHLQIQTESGSHSVLRNSNSDLCNKKIDGHLVIITLQSHFHC